jgi:hypothetical protein
LGYTGTLLNLGRVGLDIANNGSDFNETSAAGLGAGIGLNHIFEEASNVLPTRFDVPIAVVSTLTNNFLSFMVSTAAQNEANSIKNNNYGEPEQCEK